MPRHRHPHPFAARVATTLTVAFGLFAMPAAVAGHAELDSITPADKTTVDGPPSSIVAVFTEPLDPARSSLTLVDASGAVVAKGGTVDPKDTLTLTLDPTKVVPGAYSIRWTSVSAEDGDLDRGTTTFTVAVAPSAPPSSAPSASMAPSAASSAAPSIGSVPPSPTASATPATPASSTSDAVIPIVAALIVLAALGLWLLRGRARAAR